MTAAELPLPPVGDRPRSGPRVITCQTYGPVEIPLEEVLEAPGRLRLNPEIQTGDYFAVSLRKGVLTLRARGVIGYIPLNDDLVVHVRPRVHIHDLSRIVKLSGEPPTVLTSMREYATTAEWTDSLLDIYAEALIQHVETIMASGLMRDYSRRETTSSFPHGRILMNQTVQRLYPRGVRHSAYISWFERDADIAVNRCIKYALWALARRYMELQPTEPGRRRIHRKLNALFAGLADVELDHSRRFIGDAYILGARPLPTLRAYYRDALNVAKAIIEQRTILIDSPSGSVRLPSIVLNLNYVFESYIRNVLRIHAESNAWTLNVLDGNEEGRKDLFNAKPSELATPDIVLEAPNGEVWLVVEVKNVPVKEVFSERAAIDQAVTYALSYRAKRVLLVHPRKSAFQESGMKLQGVIDDVEVYQYRFDLGAPEPEEQESLFGETVGALLETS